MRLDSLANCIFAHSSYLRGQKFVVQARRAVVQKHLRRLSAAPRGCQAHSLLSYLIRSTPAHPVHLLHSRHRRTLVGARHRHVCGAEAVQAGGACHSVGCAVRTLVGNVTSTTRNPPGKSAIKGRRKLRTSLLKLVSIQYIYTALHLFLAPAINGNGARGQATTDDTRRACATS